VLFPGDHDLSSASFLGARFVSRVRQEVLQSAQQEGSEAAFLTPRTTQTPRSKDPNEELLREVLSHLRTVPLTPHMSVERVLIGPTALFQRLRGLR